MFSHFTPMLTRAVSVFVIILVASVLVTSLSFVYMDGVYSDQQSAKRAMRMWKTKISSSVESNQIIDEFESNFLRLVNQGIVGAEDRLSWFETIQGTARKRGMPLVKYGISSQEAVKAPGIKREYQGIDVFKSIMTLDIKMAHEGDLFALLNDLAKADGLYAVDLCSIEKMSKTEKSIVNNMKAYCELGWYTFKGEKPSRQKHNAS